MRRGGIVIWSLVLAAVVLATAGSEEEGRPGHRIRRGTQAQQQQPQQQQSGSSPNYADYVRQHGAPSAPGGAYPACSIQAALNDDGLICVAGSAWLALTQLVPPQLGAGSVITPPKDPNGDLPRALHALGKQLPAKVPGAVVQAEKPSYYYAYRAIQNMYGAMGSWRSSSDAQMLDLKLQGWTNGRAYRVDGTALAGDAPLVVSYTKGDQMLVVIRGTVYSREWQRDFQYRWAKTADSLGKFGLPGRVHKGFFKVFADLAGPVVDDEAARQRPKRLTITGHSLGGAVGALLAYYAAARLPDTKVELISFGAPNVGDAAFADAFNGKVNNRHLTFTGAGTDGASYYIGDWIGQSPCGAVNTCPLLTTMSDADGTGDGTVTISAATMTNDATVFTYAALGGAVDFRPEDLGNADTWRLRSDVTSLRYSPVANHVCAYSCFLAPSVGDPQDRCVFTLEWNANVPMENRCQINF